MPKKILIIDDEQDLVLSLTAYFERIGDVEVASANDAEQGVEKAKSWKPDAVLMDIYMPKFDGWEATRRLKADEATKDIPVIIMTAVLSKALLAQVHECGAARVITKPFVDRDIKRLMECIS